MASTCVSRFGCLSAGAAHARAGRFLGCATNSQQGLRDHSAWLQQCNDGGRTCADLLETVAYKFVSHTRLAKDGEVITHHAADLLTQVLGRINLTLSAGTSIGIAVSARNVGPGLQLLRRRPARVAEARLHATGRRARRVRVPRKAGAHTHHLSISGSNATLFSGPIGKSSLHEQRRCGLQVELRRAAHRPRDFGRAERMLRQLSCSPFGLERPKRALSGFPPWHGGEDSAGDWVSSLTGHEACKWHRRRRPRPPTALLAGWVRFNELAGLWLQHVCGPRICCHSRVHATTGFRSRPSRPSHRLCARRQQSGHLARKRGSRRRA